jgi:hypothetical protein
VLRFMQEFAQRGDCGFVVGRHLFGSFWKSKSGAHNVRNVSATLCQTNSFQGATSGNYLVFPVRNSRYD